MDLFDFRQLHVCDIDKLGDFFEKNNCQEITNFFYPFPITRQTAYQILNPHTKDIFFIVSLNSKFIGFSMLRGYDDGFDIPSFGMFIDYLHQKRGYGRKLIENTLTWADNRQIKTIRLAVHGLNTIAKHLYESVGFIKSEESHDKFGRAIFVMYRHLN